MSESPCSANDFGRRSIEGVMADFKRAFATVDRALLSQAVTADFEWHMHWFEHESEQPTGRILQGIDQVMEEIERRRDRWTDLRYRDVEERYGDGLIVQTFVVSGVDAGGRPFNNAAVDLYPVRDGLIAAKQTYWKQPGLF
jgi:ketosteroid isomerase-like protein